MERLERARTEIGLDDVGETDSSSRVDLKWIEHEEWSASSLLATPLAGPLHEGGERETNGKRLSSLYALCTRVDEFDSRHLHHTIVRDNTVISIHASSTAN
jgi:hypothetical protein